MIRLHMSVCVDVCPYVCLSDDFNLRANEVNVVEYVGNEISCHSFYDI